MTTRCSRRFADATRRHLLDLLSARDGRILGELAAEVDMTRFGVAQHL
ncbi:helix-turn-helix transcriptional regulator [Actinoplanes sp. N902-109]|nr:helix-turn-helix transcriptional regulator [Actinoplanes sp. N902-109]AGL14974.1 ArsR family transcriptional regulator [Actinoplanes sp. N902-109]